MVCQDGILTALFFIKNSKDNTITSTSSFCWYFGGIYVQIGALEFFMSNSELPRIYLGICSLRCKIKMKGHWSDKWASAQRPRHPLQAPSSGSGRVQNTERAPCPTAGGTPCASSSWERENAGRRGEGALPWEWQRGDSRPAFQLSPGNSLFCLLVLSTFRTRAASLERLMWPTTERGLGRRLAINSTAPGDRIRTQPPRGLGEGLPHPPWGATTCRTSTPAQEMLRGRCSSLVLKRSQHPRDYNTVISTGALTHKDLKSIP